MPRSCISSNLSLTFPRHNLDHFFLSHVFGLTSIPGRGNVSHVITSFSNCMNSFLTYLMNLVWHSSVSCRFVIRHFTISRHRGSDCVLQSLLSPNVSMTLSGPFCASLLVLIFSSSLRPHLPDEADEVVLDLLSVRGIRLSISPVCVPRVYQEFNSQSPVVFPCVSALMFERRVSVSSIVILPCFLRIELGNNNSVASVATTSVFFTVRSAFSLSMKNNVSELWYTSAPSFIWFPVTSLHLRK